MESEADVSVVQREGLLYSARLTSKGRDWDPYRAGPVCTSQLITPYVNLLRSSYEDERSNAWGQV